MSYILITADFQGVTTEHQSEISSGLEQKYWRRANESEHTISTAWYRFFPDEIPEETAKNTAIRNFLDASNLYAEPRLIVHFGADRPTFHGYPVTSLSL